MNPQIPAGKAPDLRLEFFLRDLFRDTNNKKKMQEDEEYEAKVEARVEQHKPHIIKIRRMEDVLPITDKMREAHDDIAIGGDRRIPLPNGGPRPRLPMNRPGVRVPWVKPQNMNMQPPPGAFPMPPRPLPRGAYPPPLRGPFPPQLPPQRRPPIQMTSPNNFSNININSSFGYQPRPY